MLNETSAFMSGTSGHMEKIIKKVFIRIKYNTRIFGGKALFSSYKTTLKQQLYGQKLDVGHLSALGSASVALMSVKILIKTHPGKMTKGECSK